MSLANRILDRLLARRGLVLASFLLLVVLAIPGALRLRTCNQASDFFIPGSGATVRYERFRALFGSDDALRVALVARSEVTAELLLAAGELEHDLASWPGVRAVYGLRAHHEPTIGFWPPDDPAALLQTAAENRLDRNLGLISADRRALSLLVVIDPPDVDAERDLLARLRDRLTHLPEGCRPLIYGEAALDEALDVSAREVTERFFPLLLVIAVLLLVLVFRQVEGVLLPLTLIGVTQLLLFGLLGWCGVKLDLLLAILPPLLFTVTLANAIHILMHLRDLEVRDGLTPLEAARRCFQDKGKAVLFSVLNTIAGCGSLATSLVGPVRALGLWASAGIAIMGAVTLLLSPALLATAARRFSGPRGLERRFEQTTGSTARRLTLWCAMHQRRIVIGSILIALLAVAGLPRLRTENHALSYLRADHPLRAASTELTARGIGASAVELVVELPSGEIPIDAIARLADRLRELPEVIGVVGPSDLIDDLAATMFPRGAAGTTLDPRRSAQRALAEDEQGKRVLAAYSADGGRVVRLTLFVGPGAAALSRLQREAPAVARSELPEARSIASGVEVVLLDTQRYLLRTLVSSFGSALLVILIGFWILLRSLRLALISLAPNVLPVLVVFGAVSWFRMPLDVGTAMVASIVLGLAVDDTVHTMVHFREQSARLGPDEALAATLEATAPAYLLTGAILTLGFSSLLLSDFLPTARFGALCALSVVVAIAAELLLVPALLHASRGR